jgi:hypothetical protein
MNFKNVFFVSLLAIGFAFSANAGSIDDTDGDLIPDVFDNCPNQDNGPNTFPANNQTDIRGAGIGVRCDPDYNGDGDVGVADFIIFFDVFTGLTTNPQADHNQDGDVGVADFIIFDAFFPGPPG